jgi:protein-disulfide isomerase
MKENEHETPEIIENFKEEGINTVETIDVMKHHEKHDHHHGLPSRKVVLSTPLAIIIGAVIVAVGLVAYGLITRTGGTATPTTVFAGRAIDSTDFVEGNTKSKVIVVEYSDPECPFCVQVHPSMKQIRTEYESKIGFVYRYFPLTQIHPHAYDESRALFCAGKVGGKDMFFSYIDTLFGYKTTNKTTQLPATGKEDLAKQVGIDTAGFANCMASQESRTAIDNSTADGIAAGVQGTPASFVLVKTRKGYEVVSMIDGARPYSYIKAAVDEALSR